MRFLEQVVNEIIQIPDFYKDIFLFPNKRSVLYFEKYLKKHIENPFLLPYCKDLRAFVFENSGLNKLDTFNLIFDFFEVYKNIFSNENFETFFMWSQILLRDFEEIDFSFTSPEKILMNIADLQKIDATVESWGQENPSEYRKKFFYFWDRLYDLYKNFAKFLTENKKSAYYSLALKYLIYQIRNQKIHIKGRNIYFIGFSNLLNIELELINLLKERVKFFFDVDEFFFTEKNQKSEIARMFKKIQSKLNIDIPKNQFLNQKSLKIFLVPCKNNVEQFKFCQWILKEITKNVTNIQWEDFAIILNNQSNLDILLNSFPNEIASINITLGYPLFQTYLIKVILDLLELKGLDNNTRKYQKLLFKVINEPYIQISINDEEKEKLKYITAQNFLNDVNQEIIKSISFIKNWLEIQTFYDAIQYLQDWLICLKNNFSLFSTEIQNHELYYNWLFLAKLKNHLETFNEKLEWYTFWLIFKHLAQTEYIPFSGEPLKGLQVMELVESQCLDFRYVFLMNVNEGILPQPPDYSSFIPMEIKRRYGLRTPEDFDERYAYLFYRLFYRTEKIYLFYNQTEDEEESRFIKQINILFKDFEKVHIETLSLSFGLSHVATYKAITIEKNESILQKIKQRLQNGISPTVLINYLQCPLKFYYTHIEEIQPKEEFDEDLKANELGTIAHESLREIYSYFCNNNADNHEKILFNIENLQRLLNNSSKISEIIVHNFEKNIPNKSREGRNFFLLKAIEKMVQKIIDYDVNRLKKQPIKIYGLERKVEVSQKINGTIVNFKGIIDRIEQIDGGFQIIDYKSGNIGNLSFSDFKVFSNEKILKYKEAFQLLFYCMLLRMNMVSNEQSTPIYAGIYSFKKLTEGMLQLLNEEKKLLNYQDIKETFESFIEKIIQELLNPNQSFIQTANENNCRYCPFIKNCGKFHLLN